MAGLTKDQNIQRATFNFERPGARGQQARWLNVLQPFLLAVLLAFAADLRAAGPDDGNWTSLFNGKDLSGWTVVNGGEFSVSNGVIHLDKGTGWLRTARPYTNFTFEAEWRALEPNSAKPEPKGG